jgi:hypothetical protein
MESALDWEKDDRQQASKKMHKAGFISESLY